MFRYAVQISSEVFVILRRTERDIITLRTGDADLRFYITTVQDG